MGGTKYSAAAFDLSTGSTYTTTGCIHGTQDSWTSDELLHFLSVFRPRELIVFCGPCSEETLRKQLDYTWPGALMHIRPQSMGSLDLPLAREEMLRRLYQPRTILPLAEYLHLESVTEEKVLCGVLRFVEDHFPSSFDRLQQNQVWNPANLLLLGNHALNQLQIQAQGDESVLGLFKYAATTAFGKRALRQRLLMPSADPATIRARLAEVTACISITEPAPIQRALRNIYDLPRLHRRMLCADIGSAELLALQSSYAAAAEICEQGSALGPLTPTTSQVEGLKTLAAALGRHFDLERAAGDSENTTFLPSAAHPVLAAIETKLEAATSELDQFLKVICDLAGGAALRWEAREKTPYGLRGTRTALTTIKAALGTPAATRHLAAMTAEQRTFSVSIQKAGGWVESDWLEKMNGRIVSLREQLQREFRLALSDVCSAFCSETQSLWTQTEDWLAAVDVSLALATEAQARRWTCPTIEENPNGSAFEATALRHPLIESIVSRTEYVAHNVRLDQGQGWLVYGMNASGKSSLMKSIGIAVHLAQCGCFVPATTLRLAPYRSLFTRILNQDNLWAGLSSFAVEMSEMRDILRAADRHTLVLGDELCSGTESVSAKALVAAGIEWLHERGASYVFATHLHGLTEVLPPPQEINLNIWHLKVHYDPVTQKLIYERHLTPGPGSSLYGLEVARAMNVPVAFLAKALAIRRRLLGTAAEEEAPRST
jgi:DNA mismatch repair protein MutS